MTKETRFLHFQENVSGGGIGKVAFVILGLFYGLLRGCLVSQVKRALCTGSNPNFSVSLLSFFYCHAEVCQVQDKLGGIFKCKIWTKPYKQMWAEGRMLPNYRPY